MKSKKKDIFGCCFLAVGGLMTLVAIAITIYAGWEYGWIDKSTWDPTYCFSKEFWTSNKTQILMLAAAIGFPGTIIACYGMHRIEENK